MGASLSILHEGECYLGVKQWGFLALNSMDISPGISGPTCISLGKMFDYREQAEHLETMCPEG